jgi:hypothetical protein
MRGRFIPLLAFLMLLALLSGWLMSKPSLVGRIGIDLFYREYGFLRVWWQGALAVFSTWIILLFLQGLAHYKIPGQKSAWVQVGMIALALAGFYFTYRDFKDNLSHRWLKERFHIGAYLFWAGCLLISLFYLTLRKPPRK